MKKTIFLFLLLFSSFAFSFPLTTNLQVKIYEGKHWLDGNKSVLVTLYDAASGGNTVFSENHVDSNKVVFANGVANIVLGDQNVLDSNVFFGTDAFVGIKIENGNELDRIALRAVPYAFVAKTVLDGNKTYVTQADANVWFVFVLDTNKTGRINYKAIADLNAAFFSQLDANLVFIRIADTNNFGGINIRAIADLNNAFYAQLDANSVFWKQVDLNAWLPLNYVKQSDGNNWYPRKLIDENILGNWNFANNTTFGGGFGSNGITIQNGVLYAQSLILLKDFNAATVTAIDLNGNYKPTIDATWSLGASDRRWNSIWGIDGNFTSVFASNYFGTILFSRLSLDNNASFDSRYYPRADVNANFVPYQKADKDINFGNNNLFLELLANKQLKITGGGRTANIPLIEIDYNSNVVFALPVKGRVLDINSITTGGNPITNYPVYIYAYGDYATTGLIIDVYPNQGYGTGISTNLYINNALNGAATGIQSFIIPSVNNVVGEIVSVSASIENNGTGNTTILFDAWSEGSSPVTTGLRLNGAIVNGIDLSGATLTNAIKMGNAQTLYDGTTSLSFANLKTAFDHTSLTNNPHATTYTQTGLTLPLADENLTDLSWTKLKNYPSACSAGQAVQVIGDTLTCIAVSGTDTNWQTSFYLLDVNLALSYYKQTDLNNNNLFLKVSDSNNTGKFNYKAIADLNKAFPSQLDANVWFLKGIDANLMLVRQVDGNVWYAKVSDMNAAIALRALITDVNGADALRILISDSNNIARLNAIALRDWNKLGSMDSNAIKISTGITLNNWLDQNLQTTASPQFANLTTGVGSAVAPSINFAGDTTTGFYRPSVGIIGFVDTGVEIARMDASGLQVDGAANFDGTGTHTFDGSIELPTGKYYTSAGNTALIAGTSSWLVLRTGAASDMYFDAGGNFSFRDFDSAYNVVATLDSATGKFWSKGGLNANTDMNSNRLDTNRLRVKTDANILDANIGNDLIRTLTDKNSLLIGDTNFTKNIRVDANAIVAGNIGIGMTATLIPAEKLHIRGVGTGIRLFSNFAAESESNTVLNVIDFYKHVDAGVWKTIRIYNIATFATHSYGGSDLRFAFGNTLIDKIVFNYQGKIGIGQMSPTAFLHLLAGTATASTAPLKFTSGTLLTTPEVGAIEFLTDKFYGTITTGAARKEFILGNNAIDTNTGIFFRDSALSINSGADGYMDFNADTGFRFNNRINLVSNSDINGEDANLYHATFNNTLGTSVVQIYGLEGLKLISATSPYQGFYTNATTRIGYFGYALGVTNLEIANLVANGKINLRTNNGITRFIVDENGNTTANNDLNVLKDFNASKTITGQNIIAKNTMKANSYLSSDGTAGMTDSSSYWMCADSDCTSKCQVIIKNGLITSCT